MASQLGDLMFAGPIAAACGELALWRGDPQEAVELASVAARRRRARASARSTPPSCTRSAPARTPTSPGRRGGRDDAHAAAATALGDRLRQLVDASLPLGGPPPRIRADLALCLAEAARARGEPATGAWRRACDEAAASGHRGRAAYARWRLAGSALEAGDRGAAQQALGDAAAVAAEVGHRPLLREIDDLARRARLRIAGRAPAASGLDRFELTPREHDVLGLLAEGLTNRAIAERLFISEKTTEKHVAHVLGKLGARTRGEAGAIAHRSGGS